MRLKTILSTLLVLSALATARTAQADPIVADFSSRTGTLADGASYTITTTGGGTAYNGNAGSTTSDAGLFKVSSALDYSSAPAYSNFNLTITFSQAVTASEVVAEFAGAHAQTNGEYFGLSVSGGTATTASFNVVDGAGGIWGDSGDASYNPSTGVFSPPYNNANSIIIGSTSSDTLTSLNLYGQSPGQGFAMAIGVVPAAAVPEPASLAMMGIGLAGVAVAALARRRNRSSNRVEATT